VRKRDVAHSRGVLIISSAGRIGPDAWVEIVGKYSFGLPSRRPSSLRAPHHRTRAQAGRLVESSGSKPEIPRDRSPHRPPCARTRRCGPATSECDSRSGSRVRTWFDADHAAERRRLSHRAAGSEPSAMRAIAQHPRPQTSRRSARTRSGASGFSPPNALCPSTTPSRIRPCWTRDEDRAGADSFSTASRVRTDVPLENPRAHDVGMTDSHVVLMRPERRARSMSCGPGVRIAGGGSRQRVITVLI